MNQRLTLRLPQELVEAMDLRARLAGQSVNAEYVSAVREYLGGEGQVVTVDCQAAVVHPWVGRDDVAAAQVSPVRIAMRSVDGRPDGFVVRGRVVSVDRQWFVSDHAFQSLRSRLLSRGAPLIAEGEAAWSGRVEPTVQILTFGWPGPPPRRVAAEELRLGRDAILDYLIRVSAGDEERVARASVSPEAWFLILHRIAPSLVPRWPADTKALRGADRLAARAFLDVVADESAAGAKEVLVNSLSDDLIDRICERARILRGSAVPPRKSDVQAENA